MKTAPAAIAVIAATLMISGPGSTAGNAEAVVPKNHKRLVIIDQDAYGPAGSNLQAILLLLQAPEVEVLGITKIGRASCRERV